MKILQVITSLLTGGAETLVVNLVPRLRAMGHEVDVCVFNGVETPLMEELRKENPGIKIWKLGHGYYNPVYILKLSRIMQNYDIIHTHNFSPQLFTALANIFNHKKIYTTEHSTTNRRRNWKLTAIIDRWMYSNYNHIICISDIANEKLKEFLGNEWLKKSSNRHKISTINNGVDISFIYNSSPNKDLLKQKQNRFALLMVAGFREAKDQDTIVRTMKLLDESKFEIWFAGIGARQKTVERLAKELGVINSIRFLGMRTDIPAILKAADIIIMSSHWEGLSLSNIEGMAAGKPFIASDVNGLREVTKGYGILFPEGDAKTLAKQITHLYNDHSYYTTIANRCFDRAKDFNISKTVKGYEQLYRNISK